MFWIVGYVVSIRFPMQIRYIADSTETTHSFSSFPIRQNTVVDSVEFAHESNVWSLDWHPIGHVLVSGSNDHTTRFWTRPRPGDMVQDKFHVGKQKAEEMGLKDVDVEEGLYFSRILSCALDTCNS